jgi:hypothetical protein
MSNNITLDKEIINKIIFDHTTLSLDNKRGIVKLLANKYNCKIEQIKYVIGKYRTYRKPDYTSKLINFNKPENCYLIGYLISALSIHTTNSTITRHESLSNFVFYVKNELMPTKRLREINIHKNKYYELRLGKRIGKIIAKYNNGLIFDKISKKYRKYLLQGMLDGRSVLFNHGLCLDSKQKFRLYFGSLTLSLAKYINSTYFKDSGKIYLDKRRKKYFLITKGTRAIKFLDYVYSNRINNLSNKKYQRFITLKGQ